jgi:hypothetical protein
MTPRSRIWSAIGWFLVEIADKGNLRGPFMWIYRAGNFAYAMADRPHLLKSRKS